MGVGVGATTTYLTAGPFTGLNRKYTTVMSTAIISAPMATRKKSESVSFVAAGGLEGACEGADVGPPPPPSPLCVHWFNVLTVTAPPFSVSALTASMQYKLFGHVPVYFVWSSNFTGQLYVMAPLPALAMHDGSQHMVFPEDLNDAPVLEIHC